MAPQYPGANKYVIAAFAIDGSTWWPIACPVTCNGWSLRGSVDVHLRSDPNDEATEDDLPAGATENCTVPISSGVQYRYNLGDIVLYAKSQAGATTLYGRFAQ